jgi:hypothetical protein
LVKEQVAQVVQVGLGPILIEAQAAILPLCMVAQTALILVVGAVRVAAVAATAEATQNFQPQSELETMVEEVVRGLIIVIVVYLGTIVLQAWVAAAMAVVPIPLVVVVVAAAVLVEAVLLEIKMVLPTLRVVSEALVQSVSFGQVPLDNSQQRVWVHHNK